MMPVSEQHEAMARLLETELAGVHNRICAELRSELDCVNELLKYLDRYHGKMLRPTLLLLAGQTVNPNNPPSENHRIVAAVAEMIHMATLVHDDILDEADIRRRAKTLNALRGNEAAVMLGDYILSNAYHLCVSLDSTVPSRPLAAATNTVCEGELMQLSNRYNWSLDEPTYFEIIRRKTAALCGVCCRLGATLADGTDEQADALERYGQWLGMAFQIIDDVLDLTGDQAVVGKSLHKDLEKGKLTLPLIHHLAQADDSQRSKMLQLLKSGDEQSIRSIIERVTGGDSVEYARHVAADLSDRARKELASLPDSPAHVTLNAMAAAVVDRQF